MNSTNLDNNIKKLTPWLIWVLGALFYFYENLLQVSPSIMTNDLMKAFNINKAELSILASFYFYAYAFIQIPAGILIDNFKLRNILVFSISICVLGCIVFINSHNVYQASLGRFFIGLGSGFAAVSSMKIATNWFPAKKFPFFVGLMVTVGMTGSIVGEGPLAVLTNNIGWVDAIKYLIFTGCALCLFVFLFVKENENNSPKKKKNIILILKDIKEVFVCKYSWLLAIYAGLMFAPTVIFGGLWGVPFLMEFYKISKPTAASIVSLLFLGWIIGGPVVGIIAEYINKKQLMKTGTIGTLFTLITILYFRFDSLITLSCCLFLFGFLSSCFLPAFSLIKENHNPNNSGVVLGFMNTANTLGGAIGLSIVGGLFKIKWDFILNKDVSKLYSYQLNLSLLPIMIFISFVTIYVLISKQKNIKALPAKFVSE